MTRAFSFLSELEPTRKVDRMPAPAPIKGLADTLRGQLASAVERANRIGDKAKSSVGNLHAVLDGAEDTIKDVDAAAADIQSALGLTTNGGPPLGSSSTTSVDMQKLEADLLPGSRKVEVTATGPVNR